MLRLVEMVDYGYPQVTDIESVDKFITQGKITEAMVWFFLCYSFITP